MVDEMMNRAVHNVLNTITLMVCKAGYSSSLYNHNSAIPWTLCISKHFMKVDKGTLLYTMVSTPWDCSKCFTVYSWQTCSFQHQLDFSGNYSATLQLLQEDYSFTSASLPVARCSFIQLSELWQRGVNKIAKL